jgi:hypothetical protein
LAPPVYVSGAVEGPSDERALRRIVESRGGIVNRVQVQGGKPSLRRALTGYNAAARRNPWLVLVDLDRDFPCASALATDWMPAPSAHMCFRVVVRQLESWLLADTDHFSRWFGVRRGVIPPDPDSLPDAKATLLALVGNSRKRALRADIVPRPGSGRRVGPAYSSRLMEFIANPRDGWRPDEAAKRSRSLARCLTRLEQLLARNRP